MKLLPILLILTLSGFSCPENMKPVILDGEQYCTKDDPKQVEQAYQEWLRDNVSKAIVTSELVG